MVRFVDELGENAVIMGLRVWVATDKYWSIKWRLNQLIKEAMPMEQKSPITRYMSKKRAEYEDFSSWKHQETMIFEIENFRQNCIINLK